ncbi:hypothetical protein BDA99DRAFT_535453 [Phascolomyces articulosus]|uniref:Uncharacterized protein n=1 Tax=Phascolomyces articulosus TaxID=60185 RepID=A0AAD5KDS5_9FUNG|nr:hypothetical protein BDA99DRAFT_535453 [Phascolomyces articulosus]
MSIVTLHSLDDPLKQHGDMGKQPHVKNTTINKMKTTTTTKKLSTFTSATTIVKSDSASDTTTIANDDDPTHENEIIHEEDYSFITGNSDITLAQDEIAAVVVPETTTTTTTTTDTDRPLPELPLPPCPSSPTTMTNDVIVPEETNSTTYVKLHNLKSRFKQAFRLTSNQRQRRRRQYVGVEYNPPPKDTMLDNNGVEEHTNQCVERYRESMELPAPTNHLEYYHPAAAVPTLSYSICGPGSKSAHQQQKDSYPTPPMSPIYRPLPPIPPPKMPIKGILKKKRPTTPSPSPSPEQQEHIYRSTTTASSSSSTCSSSVSSSVSSSTATTATDKQLPDTPTCFVEEQDNAMPTITMKRRSWLCKLRSTITHPSMTTTPGGLSSTGKKNEKERKRTIRYNKMVIVHETYTRHEYNREPDPNASCAYLTAEAAQDIKNELNMFKFNEMIVHPTSRIYTHFFI